MTRPRTWSRNAKAHCRGVLVLRIAAFRKGCLAMGPFPRFACWSSNLSCFACEREASNSLARGGGGPEYGANIFPSTAIMLSWRGGRCCKRAALEVKSQLDVCADCWQREKPIYQPWSVSSGISLQCVCHTARCKLLCRMETGFMNAFGLMLRVSMDMCERKECMGQREPEGFRQSRA